MPRTAITPTRLTGNAATTPVATTIDASLVSAGVNVLLPVGSTDKLLIRVANTNGSDRVITLAAGANPPAWETAALAVTVPATTGVRLIGPLDSARFLQADGTLNIDLAASFAGTLEIYMQPQGY